MEDRAHFVPLCGAHSGRTAAGLLAMKRGTQTLHAEDQILIFPLTATHLVNAIDDLLALAGVRQLCSLQGYCSDLHGHHLVNATGQLLVC